MGLAEDHGGTPEGMGEVGIFLAGEEVAMSFAVLIGIFLMRLGDVTDVRDKFLIVYSHDLSILLLSRAAAAEVGGEEGTLPNF